MKTTQPNDAPVLRHFYRPHKRVVYTGQLTNPKTGEIFTPPTRVKQSFVAECDINNILKQYSATGQLKHINGKAAQGAYLDLPDELDFQTSMNIVRDGERAFATLPSKTRDRFGNNPAEFLAFMADPKNREEALKLGLLNKPLPTNIPTAAVASTSESSAQPTTPPQTSTPASPPKA